MAMFDCKYREADASRRWQWEQQHW